jgi:hypothetical protein
VLGVIDSSPGDLQPVFEAILDKAHIDGLTLLREMKTRRPELPVMMLFIGPFPAAGAAALLKDRNRPAY